jgi:hypothetical protein
MFRVRWGQVEEEYPNKTYPDPVLVRPNKYWGVTGRPISSQWGHNY